MTEQKKSSALILFICLIVCAGLAAYIIIRFVIPIVNGTISELPEGKQYTAGDVDEKILSFVSDDVKRYSYEQLDEREKKAYDRLRNGIMAMADRVDIKELYLDLTDLRKIYSCLRDDYPEFFWIGNNCDVYTVNDKLTDCLPRYIYDMETIHMMIDRIEQITALISEKLANSSSYNKVMFVFDYLIDNTVYDSLSYENFNKGVEDANLEFACNIYGTLFKQRALCEGYAKTFQFLMGRLGIDSIYITGISKDQGHAWNYVKLDGTWYAIDVTWCDPQGKSEQKSYAYCLVNSETISAGHTPDVPYELPECRGGYYNYYIYNGFELNVFSVDMLSDLFLKAYESGNGFVEFHCANKSVYSAFLNSVETQEIFEAFSGIREKYGTIIDQLNYGLMEDALVVRIELR